MKIIFITESRDQNYSVQYQAQNGAKGQVLDQLVGLLNVPDGQAQPAMNVLQFESLELISEWEFDWKRLSWQDAPQRFTFSFQTKLEGQL